MDLSEKTRGFFVASNHHMQIHFNKLQSIKSVLKKSLVARFFLIPLIVLLASTLVIVSTFKAPVVSKSVKGVSDQVALTANLTPTPTTVVSNDSVIIAPVKYLTPTPTIYVSTKNNSGTSSSNSSTTASSSTTNSNNSSSNNTSSPTPTPTSAPQTSVTPSSTPTMSPAQQDSVNMTVNSPDGSSNFQVKLNSGADVCAVLQEAKDEGKIKSVAFDDSYMPSLHSRYVTEINGFSNNWTFTLNGASPLGCSLSHPQPNDTIVWKFG